MAETKTTDPPATTSIAHTEHGHPAARVAAEIAGGDFLTLSQAARERPAHRGRRAWGSTIWRHITQGVIAPDGQRVRLEAVRQGGAWVTSRAALARFWSRLTPIFEDTAPAAERSPRPSTAGKKANDMCADLRY